MRSVAMGMACALVVGLLAAGCGGSDAGGSKKEFAQQGSAVCVKSNTKAGSKVLVAYKRPEFVNAKTHREAINLEVTLFMPILIEDAENQLRGLRALEAPSNEEDKVEAILGAYEGWIDKAQATPLQAIFGADIFNEARELAGRYGMTKCAASPYEEPYVHN
jgi:hypothetical protein